MVKKRIIVLDDEPLIAILMKEIIEEDPELEIGQITSKKTEFLSAIETVCFDAAIVDISVGGREGGIELLESTKGKSVPPPFIMLSAHDEIHYALKCLQAGARAYINKRYICTDIVTCVKKVLDGQLFVSGDRGESILRQYSKSTSPAIEYL